MPYVGRPKPTRERQRIKDQDAAYGLHLKAMHDVEVAEAKEVERKNALPSVRREEWKVPEDSDCPYDYIEVEVRRNAKGKFSKATTHEQLAERFGLTLGSQVEPPKNPKKRS